MTARAHLVHGVLELLITFQLLDERQRNIAHIRVRDLLWPHLRSQHSCSALPNPVPTAHEMHTGT